MLPEAAKKVRRRQKAEDEDAERIGAEEAGAPCHQGLHQSQSICGRLRPLRPASSISIKQRDFMDDVIYAHVQEEIGRARIKLEALQLQLRSSLPAD